MITYFNLNRLFTIRLLSDAGTWTFINCWLTGKERGYEDSVDDDGENRKWLFKIEILAESTTFAGGE